MRLIHKIMLLVPIGVVWYWLFCALFVADTKFYKDNFQLLDTIDTVIVCASGMHFLFFYYLYTLISKAYLSCVYCIIILNFLYFYLIEEIYYFLYYSIIATYILLPIWKKKP